MVLDKGIHLTTGLIYFIPLFLTFFKLLLAFILVQYVVKLFASFPLKMSLCSEMWLGCSFQFLYQVLVEIG